MVKIICFPVTEASVAEYGPNESSFSGKATGLVSNARLTHATPAAGYAHSASRYWEDDSKIPPASRRACKDIARQLVEDQPGRNINVSSKH
jgi:alkaline phosphatase